MNKAQLRGYYTGYMSKEGFDFRSLLGDYGGFETRYTGDDPASKGFGGTATPEGKATLYNSEGVYSKNDVTDPGVLKALKEGNEDAYVDSFNKDNPGGISVEHLKKYLPGMKHYGGAAAVGGGIGAGIGALAGGPNNRFLGSMLGGGIGAIGAPGLLYLVKRLGLLDKTIKKAGSVQKQARDMTQAGITGDAFSAPINKNMKRTTFKAKPKPSLAKRPTTTATPTPATTATTATPYKASGSVSNNTSQEVVPSWRKRKTPKAKMMSNGQGASVAATAANKKKYSNIAQNQNTRKAVKTATPYNQRHAGTGSSSSSTGSGSFGAAVKPQLYNR
jgi:hypothetical protein